MISGYFWYNLVYIAQLLVYVAAFTTAALLIHHPGKGCTMGYTMVTRVGGHEYRYTEWVRGHTTSLRTKLELMTF